MVSQPEQSANAGVGSSPGPAAGGARAAQTRSEFVGVDGPQKPSGAPEPSDSSPIRHCRGFVRATSVLSFSVGALVLAGWMLRISVLTSVVPGLATMKPSTAACFILAGLGLWLLRDEAKPFRGGERWGLAASGVVVAVGVLTALEYGLGANFGIDELLFRQTLLATGIAHPGRMSLATALGFTLVGLSLLLLAVHNGWGRTRQTVALLGAFDGLMAFVGYMFDAGALYDVAPYSSMAAHTAVLMVMLGLGSLAARPRVGVMGTITSEFLGGLLVRRALPVVAFAPLVFGWIRWQGERSGFYGREIGIALNSLLTVSLLTGLLMLSAAWMNRADERRRQAEQADLRLAAIVESSTDAIVGKDLAGTITSWNKGARNLFGYSAQEVVGRSINLLIPPDRQREEKDILDRVRRGEWIESFETMRVRKGGRLVEISATISPVKDPSGRVIGASKIARDITARKIEEATLQKSLVTAEQALKDLEDQKFALDQHAIVAVTDVQGTIQYVNDKFCAISGYSREELIGQNHRIINSGHHPKEFFQEMYRSLAAGKVWHAEIKNRAKEGTYYWVDTTVVPMLNAEGKPKQYVAIRADITQRKSAQQALQQQTEDLVRSNRDLEQFAYAASHDLQEPLRAVVGCMQLLKARYQGKLDERGDEFIHHAVDGATRMQNLIDDLLAFSRVGTRATELQPVSCAEAVQNAIKNLSVAIETSRAEIECAPLPMVLGDLSQLSLLLQNLIGNALKFRGRRLPHIYVGAERQNGEWVISVQDNGIGIEPQYFERIFVIFQRLHTRKEYPGTGMGLALCKKIVERHGGRIWLDSKLGMGTTFRFTLPAANLEGEG
jgi:PAS domain S-box-containing protein